MLEARRALEIIGAGRPDEIVDVLLVEAIRGRAVGVVVALHLHAGGANRPSERDGQRHVVDAEVGEELGAGMELMAVPSLILQDAELGKPLSDEEEVADRAGARERPRHVRAPGDLDGGRRSRRDRLRQPHRHHRLIVLVVVVRSDEALDRGPIGAIDLHAVDIDSRPVAVGPFSVRLPGERELAHEGRPIVPPGVPVEMKLQLGRRARGDVAPGNGLGARDGPGGRIEPGSNRVVRVARRQWRRDAAAAGLCQDKRRRRSTDPQRRDEHVAHATGADDMIAAANAGAVSAHESVHRTSTPVAPVFDGRV